jgi:shikimate dehydrogenase
MRNFGLIGKKLGHSFSKRYFSEKFEEDAINDAVYNLYELTSIDEFPALLENNSQLVGLNVTVPYKESVIPFLNSLDDTAARVGAVNTISIKSGKLKGFNTDYIGFRNSLLQFYPVHESGKALVLGTGGASKAVCTVLSDLGVPYQLISRQAGAGILSYDAITAELIKEYSLIINTTPLGMHPDTASFPQLPYHALTPAHYLYDLVYNPEVTVFLTKGEQAGAKTKNGLEMLHGQAEAAWLIWNE